MIKFLRNILSSLATLLLSLVLAIIIWISAIQAEDPIISKSFQIPIEFVGQPADTALVLPTIPNPTMLLWVQGRATIANDMTRNDFSATLDLSEVIAGVETPLQIQVQQSEPDINIVSQSPQQMIVKLEQLISREIPVDVDIRGEVARGHSYGTESFQPEQIIVTGIASEVDPLAKALVTVTLDSADRETKVVTAQPVFYDSQGQVVSARNFQLSSQDVEVTIPINESADFAEKFVTVDLEGQPAEGYRILSVSVDPTTVFVRGRPTQLNLLSQVSTEAIDITGLTESFVTAAALDLPEGIELDEITEITVRVEIEPFESATTINRLIEVQGLADGLEALIDTDTVRIVLFGPSPVLDALAPEDVQATIDLFGLTEGTTTTIEPSVTFPDRGIELRSIQPPVVTVTITRAMTLTTEITGTLPLTGSINLHTPLPLTTFDNTIPGSNAENAVSHGIIKRMPVARPQKT
ncbi:MAG: hypothetical protein KC419_04360 [Anaerolineales bacterium]|nr:hypothetical protein [Anaerolineales bacterium]MCA9927680.1 hypothetical protein [Anaerolineales bacterium]